MEGLEQHWVRAFLLTVIVDEAHCILYPPYTLDGTFTGVEVVTGVFSQAPSSYSRQMTVTGMIVFRPKSGILRCPSRSYEKAAVAEMSSRRTLALECQPFLFFTNSVWSGSAVEQTHLRVRQTKTVNREAAQHVQALVLRLEVTVETCAPPEGCERFPVIVAAPYSLNYLQR